MKKNPAGHSPLLTQLLQRDVIALFLFAIGCLYMLLQQPYLVLSRATSANLFGGVIGCLGIINAVCIPPDFKGRMARLVRSVPFWLALVLLILLAASALHSDSPVTALSRSFVFWGTAAGGYFSASILLQRESTRRLFVIFCTLLLIVLMVGQLYGYFVYGSVHALFDETRHAQVSMAFLLLFAPVSLLLRGKTSIRWGALVLLLVVGVVLYLSGLRTAVFMPVVLIGLVVAFGAMKKRWFFLSLAVFAVLLFSYFKLYPEKRLVLDTEPVYYRVENYPFSWHVAAEHPWLGIGLGADRTPYLEGYSIKYTNVRASEGFDWSLKRINNAENAFLSLMCGVGFPFLLLYCGGVGWLVFRLMRDARRHSNLQGIPALPLLLSVLAAMGHSMLFDGLLYAQVNIFFHILLGLVPLAANAGQAPPDRATS